MATANLALESNQNSHKNNIDKQFVSSPIRVRNMNILQEREAMIVGYEVAGLEAQTKRGEGALKWICQLSDGQQIHAYLSSEIIVSAFEAMHYIGSQVQLTISTLSLNGQMKSAMIKSLAHQ